MKNFLLNRAFVYVVLLVLMGCEGNKPGTDNLIAVDVTANYPKKNLTLQDFMDVEYIPLETTDEFISKGKVADVGKNILILTNMRQGEILIFDRSTGKGLKKINRRGQGPEEYILPFNVHLNKEENEIFVNDGPSSKIQVYDLEGNYKKTIFYKKGALVTNLYDYDDLHFLSQNVYAPENDSSTSTFFLLSKEDGSWMDIEVPYEKRISPVIMKRVADRVYASVPGNSFISFYQRNWILSEPSADTIYAHCPGGDIRPFIVRTPSVQKMTPEVFLFPGVLTNRYYFMQTVKKECDFEKETDMPKVDLVYDKQEKKIYSSIVYNADFDQRKEDMSSCALNEEIAFSVQLETADLLEANGEGKLKGKLKEVTDRLNEEDNPVIMLVKLKNSSE